MKALQSNINPVAEEIIGNETITNIVHDTRSLRNGRDKRRSCKAGLIRVQTYVTISLLLTTLYSLVTAFAFVVSRD